MYQTTNKRARIAVLRAAATECQSAGFEHFAALNTEIADLLQAELDYEERRKEKENTDASA